MSGGPVDEAPAREQLLRMMLGWYANPSTWRLIVSAAPYSSGTSSPALRDSGKLAAATAAEKTAGGLIRRLCDAHEVALTALGRKAGIPDARMGEIATGSQLMPGEWESVRAALDVMTGSPC